MTGVLLSDYLPQVSDLWALAAIFAVALAFLGLGRLGTPRSGLVEIEVIAGWGVTCLMLTIWGAVTELSLRIPASGLLSLGFAALILRRWRLAGDEWKSLLRVMALSLPIWVILVPQQVAMTDTFMNLLPNLAYLVDHGVFPADIKPASYSFLPGAPYNTQFVAFIASLLTPGFYPVSGMAHFNVLLQVLSGLLIARMLQRRMDASPSWSLCAWGLLLGIALNPGFSPRVHFSSYGEAPISVALGVALWLAMRLLSRDDGRDSRARLIWQLALVLAALVSIKQASVALVIATIGSAGLLALMDRRTRSLSTLRDLSLATLPAAVLFLVWRWYVQTHFAVGELKPAPFSQWEFQQIPSLILEMLKIMTDKGYFFGCLALVIGGFGFLGFRRRFDGTVRLAGLVTLTFLAYNVFLIVTYIGHFAHEGEPGAHSYFRYSTHLSLAIVLALVAFWADWSPNGGRWRRIVPAAGVVLILAIPVFFLKRLRFDIIPPQPFVADLAQLVARHTGPQDKVAFLLPGDNTTVSWMLRTWIRFVPPRRLNLDIEASGVADPATLDSLAAKGYRKALLSCTTPAFPDLPPRNAVFLTEEGGRWRPVETLAYPSLDPRERWVGNLSSGPFCRPGAGGADADSDLAPAHSN